jgi:hypothetical protein
MSAICGVVSLALRNNMPPKLASIAFVIRVTVAPFFDASEWQLLQFAANSATPGRPPASVVVVVDAVVVVVVGVVVVEVVDVVGAVVVVVGRAVVVVVAAVVLVDDVGAVLLVDVDAAVVVVVAAVVVVVVGTKARVVAVIWTEAALSPAMFCAVTT